MLGRYNHENTRLQFLFMYAVSQTPGNRVRSTNQSCLDKPCSRVICKENCVVKYSIKYSDMAYELVSRLGWSGLQVLKCNTRYLPKEGHDWVWDSFLAQREKGWWNISCSWRKHGKMYGWAAKKHSTCYDVGRKTMQRHVNAGRTNQKRQVNTPTAHQVQCNEQT